MAKISSVRYSDAYVGAVMCGALFSWIGLILAIFAAASPWWSWGVVGQNGSSGNIATSGKSEVAASPYIAGVAWAQLTDSGAVTSTYPLYWSALQSASVGDSVCANTTSPVFTKWAQPFGYCQLTPTGAYTFVAPYNPINAQGLTVSACVFGFLAALAGCAQGASFDLDPVGGYQTKVGVLASFLAFLACLLSLSAFSLWADWSWAQAVQNTSYMPIWIFGNSVVGVIKVTMVFGSAFGTCIAAFCMFFFAAVIHAVAAFDFFGARAHFEDEGKPAPESGAPASASAPASVPATAGATPVVQV